MSKAYEHAEWPIILSILRKTGFDESVVALIMRFIPSVSYSFSLNWGSCE